MRAAVGASIAVLLGAATLLAPATACAQGLAADYARARARLPWELKIPNQSVNATWSADGNSFWYRRDTVGGGEYVRVDAVTGERRPAFDHARLAAALAAEAGQAMSADDLPLQQIEGIDTASLRVSWRGDKPGTADCDLRQPRCVKLDIGTAQPGEVLSPDGRWAAYVRDHNLHVRATAGGDGSSRALTRDGSLHNAWGAVSESHLYTISAVRGLPTADQVHGVARVLWSPDSSRVLSYQVDERGIPELPFIDSVPAAGYGHRPVLHTARVAFPDDDAVPLAKLAIFEVASGRRIDVDAPPLLDHYDLIDQDRLWWSDNGEQVYYYSEDRGFRRLGLHVVDAASGRSQRLLEEASRTWIEPKIGDPRQTTRIDDSVFWLSERDGWQHLYRYDRSGTLRNALTSGQWRVDDLLHVDAEGGWVYFLARARETGRDPYYQHLYRARFDGSGLELLTHEDAQHDIQFAPDGRHFIDRHSRVDTAPVTTLRRADGTAVATLETADLSALKAMGWQPPERFRVKGRDGKTDIHGVLYRPSNFDPARRYPILDHIYGGPQLIYAPRQFTAGPPIAELGFMVVQIDGMGTPGRSRAFQEQSYAAGFAEAGGLADHVAAIRELAERYPQIDLDRVGIFGHSGGGYSSARAMFDYPDFYKVAVSSAGSHDQRLYQMEWGERFIGRPQWDPAAYALQANTHDVSKLRGKLLLIHGELDDDVHPVNTMQVVDALIRADKDFDLLIVPGRNHRVDRTPYFLRRQWDYFVRHLMGIEPPAERRIDK
ncbi:S9 family peptidase [Luteimonas sp. RIT-PG2_3]